jgi:uncharacterized membrane protein YhiD involved in acid resistance
MNLARLAKRHGRAVLLHGMWNASAIGIAVGFSVAALLWLGLLSLIVLIVLIARTRAPRRRAP